MRRSAKRKAMAQATKDSHHQHFAMRLKRERPSPAPFPDFSTRSRCSLGRNDRKEKPPVTGGFLFGIQRKGVGGWEAKAPVGLLPTPGERKQEGTQARRASSPKIARRLPSPAPFPDFSTRSRCSLGRNDRKEKPPFTGGFLFGIQRKGVGGRTGKATLNGWLFYYWRTPFHGSGVPSAPSST